MLKILNLIHVYVLKSSNQYVWLRNTILIPPIRADIFNKFRNFRHKQHFNKSMIVYYFCGIDNS